jgi:hypothetical protein
VDRAGVLPANGAGMVSPGSVLDVSTAGFVMAGEWLKFEKATLDKPEVLAIAATMECDPDFVIGKLFRMWAWFDTHTENGNAHGVTLALLDSILRVTGFSENVQKVGWLIVSDTGITLPNFDRHCGETAKRRALTAKRVAGFKHSHKKGNAANVTHALPREEKKREEKKKEQKQKQRPPAAPVAATMPDLPTWVNREAWDGFAAMRKRDRHPLTPRAAKLVLTELGKLRDGGHDPNAVLDQSTRNSWRDVWPVKDGGRVTAVGGRVAI